MTGNRFHGTYRGIVFLFLVALLSFGCNPTESGEVPVDRCTEDEDCLKGFVCVDFRCVLPSEDGDTDPVHENDEAVDTDDSTDGDDTDATDADGDATDDDLDAVDADGDDDTDVIPEQEPDPEPEIEAEPEEELPAPAGNTCGDAVPVTINPQPVSIDSRGAWSSSLESTIECTGRAQRGPDMFFSISLAADEAVLVTVTPQAEFKLDLSIAVLDSCDQGQQCIAGKDLDGRDPEWMHFRAPSAGTYYIVVGTSVNTPDNPLDFNIAGMFDLLVASAAPKEQCMPCDDTYNLGFPYCGIEAGCYSFIYDNQTVEAACLRGCESNDDCGSPLLTCRSVPVDGGASSGMYCVPGYEGANIATCSAIRELGQPCTDNELSGDDDDQCGADDVQVINDAECVTSGLLPPMSYCSVKCQGEAEVCPEGFSCINIPLVGKYCSPE